MHNFGNTLMKPLWSKWTSHDIIHHVAHIHGKPFPFGVRIQISVLRRQCSHRNPFHNSALDLLVKEVPLEHGKIKRVVETPIRALGFDIPHLPNEHIAWQCLGKPPICRSDSNAARTTINTPHSG